MKKLISVTMSGFQWTRQSWKRFSAPVGPLRIEIVKRGNHEWAIGEVMGQHWLGPRRTWENPEDAMKEAAKAAKKALREATLALGKQR